MKRLHKLCVQQLESRITPVVGANGDAPTTDRGDFYNGVVAVRVPTDKAGVNEFFTGGLFKTGQGQGFGHYIVTVAHGLVPSKQPAQVEFELARAKNPVDIFIDVPLGTDYQIQHPDYNPSNRTQPDVAILKLVDQDSSVRTPTRLLVPPYPAAQYTFSAPGVDVSGKMIEFAGYGYTGNGTTGQRDGTSGVKRSGMNVMDVPNDGAVYGYDMDPAINGGSGTLSLGANESIAVGSDSGSPVFIDSKIVGVSSYIIHGDKNVLGKFGDQYRVVRVSPFRDSLIAAYVDKAGKYDLVFDMEQQVYGQSGPGGANDKTPDDLTIVAEKVDDQLQISVIGTSLGADPNLNGVYYKVPAANINSLILRGSNDNETFRINGDLGINGGVYVDGRGGTNGILYDDTQAPATRHNYTVTSKTDVGYTLRMHRAVGDAEVGIPPIDSKNVSKYEIYASPGANKVRIDSAPAELTRGLAVHLGFGDDTVHIGTEGQAPGLGDIQAIVSVDDAGGNDTLFFQDAGGTNTQHNYSLGNGPTGFDARLNWARDPNLQQPVAADIKGIEQYTLNTSPGPDLVYLEKVSAAAGKGVVINANAGPDVVVIGSPAKGLDAIDANVAVDGGPGDNSLTIDNLAGVESKQFTGTATQVVRMGGPTVTYVNVGSLSLTGSDKTGRHGVCALAV